MSGAVRRTRSGVVATVLCLAVLAAAALSAAPRANAYVYWGSYAYGLGVGRVALDGSGVQPAFIPPAAGQYAFGRGVASDGTHVYWTNHNPGSTLNPPVIGRALTDGSEVNQAFSAAPGNVMGMTVSGTHIYMSIQSQDTSAIARTSIVGGQGIEQYASVFGQPNPLTCGIAVDDTYVYWANRGTSSIGRATLAGFGTPSQVVDGEFIKLPLTSMPCGVAVDATHIYWGIHAKVVSAALVGGTTIGRATKATGGDVNNAFLDGGDWITGLAIQGDTLYWSSFANYAPTGGKIGRGSLTTGTSDPNFVTGLNSPWGIAADGLGPPAAAPPANVLVPQPATPAPIYAPGGGSGATAGDGVRPDFSRVWTTHPVFTPATWTTPISVTTSAAVPKGTVFNYVLDRAATVKIVIAREGSGRRSGRRCVKATPKLRSKPACRRFTTVATLTRVSRAGKTSVPFSGRIRKRALPVGRYRAVFTARSGAGAGASKTVAFRIVKP